MSIAFGFIGEFILRRSKEVGSENWGKAISCDPPQFFPDVKFYWARDYFPNFVEEDRRVSELCQCEHLWYEAWSD